MEKVLFEAIGSGNIMIIFLLLYAFPVFAFLLVFHKLTKLIDLLTIEIRSSKEAQRKSIQSLRELILYKQGPYIPNEEEG